MPFVTLQSEGLSIVCFLVEHDWETKFSVSHYFPAAITAGLTNREERVPQAEAMLLTVGVDILAEAEEAQALRETFATLGKSWVGVPILADAFLGADSANPEYRIYAPQKLLDLTAPAIVPATATLVPDHEYAPLVVGHVTELPDLNPLSGNLAVCPMTLTEDSPWAFRVGAFTAVSPGTWPDILIPDWSSAPTQTPVSGLEFGRIGLLREQTIAHEEMAFQWTVESTFGLSGKREISTLVAFFASSRGPYLPFDASLWFTPGEATATAPHASKVRFGDATLKLEFTTSCEAEAKIKFIQLPWEILGTAGETPQRPPRIFLYQFTYDVPGPVYWRYTNCWRPLSRSGDGVYESRPFDHSSLTGGLDLQAEDVKLDSFLFEGSPFALFNPDVLEGKLWLKVFEIASDPINPDAAELVWTGTIVAAPQTGRKIEAEGKWLGGILEQEFPNVRVGPLCNTCFLSSRCKHLKADWAQYGTLAAANGAKVVVANGDVSAANTYAPGKLELGVGLSYEGRLIVSSRPVADGQELTLDFGLRQAPYGQQVTYYRSCDRTVARCKELDPTGWKRRFRGHPNVPTKNLSLPSTNDTATGKK